MGPRTVIHLASRVALRDTATMSDGIKALAKQYHGELLRILRSRLRNEADAADLAQEAYARLLKYPRELSGAELRNMLFRIADNLLTDHWRWSRVRQHDSHVALEALNVESHDPAQDRRLAAQQQLEQLIGRMPDKRRTVFILSRLYGLTNAEVARQCGISLKTVEKHLTLALAECHAFALECSREVS
jgi:RNA polymerase sigma-70 factor (ECF subfamily)